MVAPRGFVTAPGLDGSRTRARSRALEAAESGLHVVEAHHQRRAELAAQREHQIHDLRAPGRVEAGDRLVGEDRPRLLGEHASGGDPLLLAAREPVRALEQLLVESHLRQRLPYAVDVFSGSGSPLLVFHESPKSADTAGGELSSRRMYLAGGSRTHTTMSPGYRRRPLLVD